MHDINRKKAWLREIKKYRSKRKILEAMLKNLHMRDTSYSAIRYDKDSVQSSPVNQMEEQAWAMIEKSLELQGDIMECISQIDIRLEAIKAIDDGTLSELLYLHYVECLSLEDVSEKLNYNYTWTSELHTKAIELLECPERI